MKILLSNDDGIHANGINVLAEILSTEYDIYIAAPDRERSAASHSMTLHSSLNVTELPPINNIKKRFAISGTPVDCVKLAINALLQPEELPDLVVSGINHGPNLGFDIMYSGTVSCAREAATLGFPSIAVSLDGRLHEKENFLHVAQFIKDFIKDIKNYRFPTNTLLNINFPPCPKEEIKGISIATVGNKVFSDYYEKRIDAQKISYVQAGKRILTSNEIDTDIAAIRENKIAITPLTFDLCKDDNLRELKTIFDKTNAMV